MLDNVISIDQVKTAPSIEKGKVDPPTRKKNKELRPREYLTGTEVDLLKKQPRLCTRLATPSYPRIDSRDFGEINLVKPT